MERQHTAPTDPGSGCKASRQRRPRGLASRQRHQMITDALWHMRVMIDKAGAGKMDPSEARAVLQRAQSACEKLEADGKPAKIQTIEELAAKLTTVLAGYQAPAIMAPALQNDLMSIRGEDWDLHEMQPAVWGNRTRSMSNDSCEEGAPSISPMSADIASIQAECSEQIQEELGTSFAHAYRDTLIDDVVAHALPDDY